MGQAAAAAAEPPAAEPPASGKPRSLSVASLAEAGPADAGSPDATRQTTPESEAGSLQTPRSPSSERPSPKTRSSPRNTPRSVSKSSVASAPAGARGGRIPSLTPQTIISTSGVFSSYARPMEVEYQDAEGDWTAFVRNPNGKVDLVVDGELRLRSLTAIRVEGFKLHVEGTSPDEPPSPPLYTSALVADEVAARSRRHRAPPTAGGSVEDILRRLDRSEEANEDVEDWSHVDEIIRRVMSLFGQPEALALQPELPSLLEQETGEWDPCGGLDQAEADMTPEGFRVLCTRHTAVLKATGEQDRRISVLTTGLYFFVDVRSCPRFDFSDVPLDVEQWRGGCLLWSGKVCIWEGTSGAHDGAAGCTAHGCRYPASKAAREGQWDVGDTVFVIGCHTDARGFAGAGYGENLTTYEARVGCGRGDAAEESLELPRGLTRGSEAGPGMGRLATLTSAVTRSSSASSLDREEQHAGVTHSERDATMSRGMSVMGNLLTSNSQVRKMQLACLRVEHG
mmetsp:Transcript_103940/g.325237  ORF Transcript_103940/g.325237 Transcript_103940/m.325237 type:complete len:510 (-) Transcript_103940:227-1756(-)